MLTTGKLIKLVCRSSATFQFGPASSSTGSQAFVPGPVSNISSSQTYAQGTTPFVCSLSVNDGTAFVVYGAYSDVLCTSPVVRDLPSPCFRWEINVPDSSFPCGMPCCLAMQSASWVHGILAALYACSSAIRITPSPKFQL